ncbi:nucleotidyltransferase family protein [Streptomyces scabichelini]|uniref:nucleotidyltransferase family protein n=1 Tax=Streptomyces scabichelini TaxID=2711217 RepID=UPI003B96DB01
MAQNADDAALDGRRPVTELHLAGGAAEEPRREDVRAEKDLPPDRHQAILEATKQVAAVLKRHGHDFALAGSVAVYAHGGVGNLQHDADFCIRPEDAEEIAATLEEAGLTVYAPPEDWLLKAKCLGQDVDLIFGLAHEPVSTELLGRAMDLSVDSVQMPVLAPTDLLRSLVAAFSEHHCDFGAVLPIARLLREKVDWERIRREFGDAPMPAAFLYLLERLDVIAPQGGHR